MTDQVQQGLQDRKLQDYYEALETMFSTKGWEYFLEDMRKLYEQASTIEGVETGDQLHFRKGQLDIIKLVVAQPAVTAAAYEELLADEHGTPREAE